MDFFFVKEQLNWFKLNYRISKSCLIVNTLKVNEHLVNSVPTFETSESVQSDENKTPRASQVNDALTSIVTAATNKSVEPFFMTANFFKYESTATVTDTIRQLKDIVNDKGLLSGLSCSQSECEDDFLADLAVGCQANFLRVGGFNRSERVSKLNRLIDIEDHLIENKLLKVSNESEFKFNVNLETPMDLRDALVLYRQSLEETKANAKHTKKN